MEPTSSLTAYFLQNVQSEPMKVYCADEKNDCALELDVQEKIALNALDEAFEIGKRIVNPEKRIAALAFYALAIYGTGVLQNFHFFMELIYREPSTTQAFWEVTYRMAQDENITGLQELLFSFPTRMERVQIVQYLVEKLAFAQRVSEAKRIGELIEDPLVKIHVYQYISNSLANNQQFHEAEQLASSIEKPLVQIDARYHMFKKLVEFDRLEEALSSIFDTLVFIQKHNFCLKPLLSEIESSVSKISQTINDRLEKLKGSCI